MRIKRQLSLVEFYFKDFIEFRRRGESIYAVERVAQLLIQSILDVGAMIAIKLGFRKPESYKGIADLIADKLNLYEDDRRFLISLAGFGNLLVHGYGEIDRKLEEEAFGEIEKRLGGIIDALRTFIDGLDDPREGLNQFIRKLREVFEKYRVRYALLFGSIAREGFGRDIDIAVSMDVENALELGRLITDIAEVLGVREEQIDLIHIDSANLGMIYTVLDEGILIYGSPEEAEEHLYKRYIELLDLVLLY
ncbi:MAG: HepT-like ribonuclease domain-containing protein [Candidatus Bathyarchaeia archaeon]